MTNLSLEQRLDRLESRVSIAELGSSYAVACDQRDMRRLLNTFASDASIRSVNGIMDAQGRSGIATMFENMFAIRGPAYHWTHDRFVWFDDADCDRATGQVFAHAETTLNGVASLAALRYDDEYVRVGGEWKFAKRNLSFLYYVPLKDYLERLPTSARFHHQGDYRAADFPESLPSWQEFYASDKPPS